MMYAYHDTMYVPEGDALTGVRNREYTSSLSGLERAMATGAILEGTVTLCDPQLNLHIDFVGLPNVHGLMERSEVVYTHEGESAKDIAILTRVGKTETNHGCKIDDLTALRNGGKTKRTDVFAYNDHIDGAVKNQERIGCHKRQSKQDQLLCNAPLRKILG